MIFPLFLLPFLPGAQNKVLAGGPDKLEWAGGNNLKLACRLANWDGLLDGMVGHLPSCFRGGHGWSYSIFL